MIKYKNGYFFSPLIEWQNFRPKSDILPPNLNDNWMTAVIGWSRHVTGWATPRLVGGGIQDFEQIFPIFNFSLK